MSEIVQNREVDTLRKELAETRHSLQNALQASREAERAKKEYMQNVAHQLTAPINAIKMTIESLQNPKIAVARKQVMLRSAYSQGTILVHLIKNFSLMSHLEADHDLNAFREQPEDFELYNLCINLCNDFQPIGSARDQKVIVNHDDFKKHGMPALFTIKNLLAQVIYNLLENATKYADADSTIQVRLKKESGAFILTVESCGIPIEISETEQIFERSYRGRNAKPKNPAGTGFGLYIARRIMVILRGQLWVVPQGRWSRFNVQLPTK